MEGIAIRPAMVAVILVPVVLATAAGGAPQARCVNPPPPEQLYAAVVARVVDGDTIDVISDDRRVRVRLIGIDTPEVYAGAKPNRDAWQSGRSRETIKALGRMASAYTKRHLLGAQIGLELDVETFDRYRRLLAYVWLEGGTLFNMQIVRDGFADVATYPPNVKYVDLFIACQRDAREAGRGLWGR